MNKLKYLIAFTVLVLLIVPPASGTFERIASGTETGRYGGHINYDDTRGYLIVGTYASTSIFNIDDLSGSGFVLRDTHYWNNFAGLIDIGIVTDGTGRDWLIAPGYSSDYYFWFNVTDPDDWKGNGTCGTVEPTYNYIIKSDYQQYIQKLHIDGDYMYTTSGYDRDINIWNVATPSCPATLTLAVFSCRDAYGSSAIFDVITDSTGNYIYVTSYGSNDVAVINVTNKLVPVYIEKLTFAGDEYGVGFIDRKDDYLFVASKRDSVIRIIDISTPSALVLDNTFSVGGTITGFKIVNDTLAWAGGSKMGLINISDPTNPVIIEEYTGLTGDNISGSYDADFDDINDIIYISTWTDPTYITAWQWTLTPPAVITEVTYTEGETSINFEWTGTGIDYVEIYRDSVLINTSTGSSYTDEGLTQGIDYNYEFIPYNPLDVAGTSYEVTINIETGTVIPIRPVYDGPTSPSTSSFIINEPKSSLLLIIEEIVIHVSKSSNWLALLFAYIGAVLGIVLMIALSDIIIDELSAVANTLLSGTLGWIIVLIINFGGITLIGINEIFDSLIFLIFGLLVSIILISYFEEENKPITRGRKR